MLIGRGARWPRAMTAAVAAGVWMFPLQGQAQALPDGPGITVVTGAALLHRSPLQSPTGAQGSVVVDATLNTEGRGYGCSRGERA